MQRRKRRIGLMRAVFTPAVAFLCLAAFPAFSGDFEKRLERAEPESLPDAAFLQPGGGKLSLAEFKGKPVVLNFWASWCVPCVKEMPSLARLRQALEPDIAVIALSEDFFGARAAESFFALHNIRGLTPYADDKAALLNALKVKGLPTTVFIRADGKEIARLAGPADWDDPAVRAAVKALLKE